MHLSEDCRLLLAKAAEIIDVNHWENPHQKVIEKSWRADQCLVLPGV
jgi:hypothetical protein